VSCLRVTRRSVSRPFLPSCRSCYSGPDSTPVREASWGGSQTARGASAPLPAAVDRRGNGRLLHRLRRPRTGARLPGAFIWGSFGPG
jgi:hypothetical protein